MPSWVADLALSRLGLEVEWIVTDNIKDIAAGELVFDSFRVVTPGDWLKMEDD